MHAGCGLTRTEINRAKRPIRVVKMMLLRVTGGKLGRMFSLGLLLVAACVSLINGQQGTRLCCSLGARS